MDMANRNIISNEIDLLLTLAVEPSCTSAAEALDLTQSAISRTVKEVEQKLGQQLFTRGRSGSDPTWKLTALVPG
jgi:DNA-binding transcriptional LysR family regulator